jgi:hypothetical protein
MHAVDTRPWDPSVKALTQFPSVLDNLAKNPLAPEGIVVMTSRKDNADDKSCFMKALIIFFSPSKKKHRDALCSRVRYRRINSKVPDPSVGYYSRHLPLLARLATHQPYCFDRRHPNRDRAFRRSYAESNNKSVGMDTSTSTRKPIERGLA